jgi:arylsulfatase A-like enzyme
LQTTGLADNTIVVLFGDQGYHLGERDGFFSKGNLWERSLLVPLLVATPDGHRAGKVCDRPVALLDLYPTLVDLCGLEAPPSPLDGESFAELLSDADASWRDWAVSYAHDKRRKALSRTIRTHRYRYTERPDGTPMALIDYQEDPYEWQNLADDPSRADLQGRMRKLLTDAVAKHPASTP